MSGSEWGHTCWVPPDTAQMNCPASVGSVFAHQPELRSNKRQKGPDGAPIITDQPCQPKKAQLERTYKIQMLPTPEQREELRRIFEISRIAYNFANKRVKARYAQDPDAGPARAANFYTIRNEWAHLPPETFPQGVDKGFAKLAVRQLTYAYASTLKNKTQMRGSLPSIKYIKMAPSSSIPNYDESDEEDSEYATKYTEVIHIACDPKNPTKVKGDPGQTRMNKGSQLLRFAPTPKSSRRRHPECVAHFGMDLSKMGGIRLRDSPRVISKLLSDGSRLQHECKIMWDHRTNIFHFLYCFTLPVLPDPDPSFSSKRIVSLDPGSKPFQHWFSPTSGAHGTLLDGDALKKRLQYIEKLKEHIRDRKETRPRPQRPHSEFKHTSKYRHRSTRRLKNRLARAQVRLHNWMRSGHYDAANFLLRQHDIIIAPILNVAKMVSEDGLCRNGKRKMLAWSHYKFRQRLISASARYEGRHVLETREPGTSKTCTQCGHWNASLALGDEVFRCPNCALCVDRQLAGARNNFLAAYGCALGVYWDEKSA